MQLVRDLFACQAANQQAQDLVFTYPSRTEPSLRGVSLDKNQAKVTLVGLPDKPGVAARVFKAIGDANINVDMIVQNISHGSGKPATDLSFTVDKPDLIKARKVIEGLREEVGFGEVIATDAIGKLSIVGVGMKSHSGIAGKMFETLAGEGVNIDMISTSEIKISVIVKRDMADKAVKLLHKEFKLDKKGKNGR